MSSGLQMKFGPIARRLALTLLITVLTACRYQPIIPTDHGCTHHNCTVAQELRP